MRFDISVSEAVTNRFDISNQGTTQFLISQESDAFVQRVEKMFPESSYSIEIFGTQPGREAGRFSTISA
jgi:hypothetical protein